MIDSRISMCIEERKRGRVDDIIIPLTSILRVLLSNRLDLSVRKMQTYRQILYKRYRRAFKNSCFHRDNITPVLLASGS